MATEPDRYSLSWDRGEGSQPVCPDCDGTTVYGPDFEGFYDCGHCGAAWLPGVGVGED